MTAAYPVIGVDNDSQASLLLAEQGAQAPQPPTPFGNGRASRVWRVFATLVSIALALGFVTVIVIAIVALIEARSSSSVPKGAVVREADQCVFSHREVLNKYATYLNYTNEYVTCTLWLSDSQNWDRFTGSNPFPKWDYEGSEDFVAAETLRAQMLELIYGEKSKTITDQERMGLHMAYTEAFVHHNLSRLHHLHLTMYDPVWGYNFSPIDCNFYHAFFVPLFSHKPDYVPKALAYMRNTRESFRRMNEYFVRAIDAGIVEFSLAAQRVWNLYWQWDTLPGMLQPICAEMTGADLAECTAIEAEYETEAALFRNIYVNQYLPACAAIRGLNTPSRTLLPNGTDASLVWWRWWYGDLTLTDAEEFSALNWREVSTYRAIAADLVDELYPGLTLDGWNAKTANKNDTDVWLCADSTQPILAHILEMLYVNITPAMHKVFGYQSRERDYVTVTVPAVGSIVNSAGARYSGKWDALAMLWRDQGYFNIVVERHPTTQQPCFRKQWYGIVVHENLHSVHVGLLPRACHPDGLKLVWTFPFASVAEGLAVYAEDMFIDGEYVSLYDECTECMLGALGIGGNLRVAQMYNFNLFGNMTWAQCMANQTGVLAESGCYRTIVSLQHIAYGPSAIRFQAMRQRAEQALGSAFDVQHFHKLLFKAGRVSLDWYDLLVDTYIAWRQGLPAAKQMFGYDYVTHWIFGNTETPCLAADQLDVVDDVISKVATPTATASSAHAAQIASAIEAKIKDDPVFAQHFERLTNIKGKRGARMM